MNLGTLSLRNRTGLLVLTVVFAAGGALSYSMMGRLEDPEFTIKQAQVVTRYPGATALEVEEQVTEIIERAAQQMGQVDYVKSSSGRGVSTVDVMVKDHYNKNSLPQVWDELRRKINDVQSQLPPGAGPSMVYDDFGDVYGIFFAITGDGYSMAELKDTAKFLQRELLTVRDVAKIQIVAARREAVYIEPSPAKMAQLGVNREAVFRALQSENLVSDAGEGVAGGLRVAIRPSSEFASAEDIGGLLIAGGGTQSGGQPLIYLRDIAEIVREYADPPGFLLRVDGKPAIGLAISTVQGGNVVVMGEAIKKRMEAIYEQRLLPFGLEYHPVSIQSDAVTEAISGFVLSLVEAVAIVIGVLLLFMGLRSGLIIGGVLLITILGSFVFMYGMGIMLERISLGALIIALGMLVDNAIVITEGMLVGIQRGENREELAGRVVGKNALPLLGATVVAILAFAAIGASNDSSGEYTRSLFQVITITLLFSWVTAVTVTPLFCVMFLKPGHPVSQPGDVYNNSFFRAYKSLLSMALRRRGWVAGGLAAMLVLSLFGFGLVDQAFFPNSTRPQFMVDFWLPEGTHIHTTEDRAAEAEKLLAQYEHVRSVASFIGQGPPRYLLTLNPESPNSSYAHFLVSVDDHTAIEDLSRTIQEDMSRAFPDAIVQSYKFALGPGAANKIQIRIQGPDRMELRRLAGEVMDVIHDAGGFAGTQTDWRTPVKEYRPVLNVSRLRQLGIGRPEVADRIKENFDGSQVGVFLEGDEMLPILVRAPRNERPGLGSIDSLLIHSPAAGTQIPLSQLVTGYETVMADSMIKRRDRVRTITVKCNPLDGGAAPALERIMPAVNAIQMPPGYTLTYGGEYEDSRKANAALQNKVLFCGLLMVLVVILLFNALRQPLIVWMCVPLSLIGVTLGLLATGQPFGFMALLGLLSLSGMLIKNAIVLIDEIDAQIQSGAQVRNAIVDSGVSRMRPVMMAAATTVLGMIPLFFDAFFAAMAVTIMAGLAFATVLTLIAVPVFYAMLFRA